MAFALDQIGQGNIPNDRLALRELARELNSWPIVRKGLKKAAGELDPERAEPRKAASVSDLAEEDLAPIAPQPTMGRGDEAPQGLADLLPDWAGYSVLYLISAIPVFIAVGAITVLFINSLR